MAAAPNRPKPHKIRRGIEWTTIPVWYVYTGGAAILLVLGIGGFLAYQAMFGPQKKARRAISVAQSKHDEASHLAKPGEHDRLLASAESKLEEARAAARETQWDIAFVSARESATNSQEIIDAAAARPSLNVASFKRMSGTIEVKKANATQWVPANADTILGPNDLVKSDPSSRAEILYSNGTRIVVDPNSLIQIVRPERTEVTAGKTEVTTGRINHSVQTADGTEIEVAQASVTQVIMDRDRNRTRVDVGEGTASVKKKGETVSLSVNETVESSEAGLGTVEKLPERPRTPDNLQLFEYEKDARSLVTIRWEPVPEAVKYAVETGTDSLLSGRHVARLDVTKNALEIDGYPDGDYYWRVTAINGAGKASMPSGIQTFRIGPKGTSSAERATVPVPPLSIDLITTLGSTIILKGRTEPTVSVTVDGENVEVKGDGSFHSVTPLREDGRNVVVITARNALGGVRKTKVIAWADYF